MKVRAILATVGNYSHVIVDNETFNKVIERDSEGKLLLAPKKGVDSQGRKLSVYTIEGVTLINRYEDGKSSFIMKADDAERLLSTRAMEQAELPVFDLAV